MARLTFVKADGEHLDVDAQNGLSVMQIGRAHDLIEGACDGSLACATCHVIVERSDFTRTGEAGPEEEDMLDLAIGLEPTSRLGCQIVLCDALDGLVVRLPEHV